MAIFQCQIGLLLMILTCTNGFIIPQELPSLLSLVYSNVPPIKKGTDSRIGFGFRLGDHADFQIMYEIGPQTHTKKLRDPSKFGSDDDDDDSMTSKRNVRPEDYVPPAKTSNPMGTDWLKNWSQDMKKKTKKTPPTNLPLENGNGSQQPVPQTRPIIAESALRQLQQLYGIKSNENPTDKLGTKSGDQMPPFIPMPLSNNGPVVKPNVKTKEERKRITADLMDVELD